MKTEKEIKDGIEEYKRALAWWMNEFKDNTTMEEILTIMEYKLRYSERISALSWVLTNTDVNLDSDAEPGSPTAK